MEKQTECLHVYALCTGPAESVAKNLRELADQIEKGEKPSIRNCGMRAFTRLPFEDTPDGEHVVEGTYYAVGSCDDPISQPFAIFHKFEMADSYANLVTKYNLDNATVARVHLFGSLYNGTSDDPHKDEM